MKIAFEVPMKVVSALNAREHPLARSRRVKNERRRALLAYRMSKPEAIAPLLRVTLTRVGPRALDLGDNLASSLKGVRDQVACILGVDDGGPLVEWCYRQDRGEYAVRVVVEDVAGVGP